MTLSEAFDLFDLAMTGVRADSTRALYGYTFRKLVEFLGAGIELDQISIVDLRRWRAELVAGELSVYTLHRDIRQARQFFRWFVDEGLLEASPAIRLELPRLPSGEPPKAVSAEDLILMLRAARRRDNLRDEAILRFLAETGCRLGGLLSLRPEDLDLSKNVATVREKGQKSRTVSFGEETKFILRAYLVERPMYLHGGSRRNRTCTRPDDRFFLGRQGNLTQSGVYRILQAIALNSGAEGRHNPHAHRHGLARRLLEHGCDMGTVSQILGHRDIETTHKFYARWTEDELMKRHRKFGGTLDR